MIAVAAVLYPFESKAQDGLAFPPEMCYDCTKLNDIETATE